MSAQGRVINNKVNCHHNTATSSKQTFAGWMLYNRFWFKKDTYGVTIGGGAMANPGRYLTLLPPINGADAITHSPYFRQNPIRPGIARSPLTGCLGNTSRSELVRISPRERSLLDWPRRYYARRERAAQHDPESERGFRSRRHKLGSGPVPICHTGLHLVAGASGWCPDLRKDEPR